MEAWSNLGAVYNDGFSDFEKSRDCFRRALSLNPDSLIVKTNLAEILILLKDYREVEPLLNEVINGTDKPVYGFVSRILLVIYYYLQLGVDQKSHTARVFDLLSYYETVPMGSEINWCFSNLHKIINDATGISPYEKHLLNSLLDLKEKLKVEERKICVD